MYRLPNAITIARIVLVPVFAIAFSMPGDTWRLVAFFLFCIAGLSDALDGLAARKLNAGSDFGRMLDPIADKVLVAVALMMLVAEGNIEQFNLEPGLHSLLKLVPALIILSREILVSGLREYLAGLRVSVPVTKLAKWKTTMQLVAIGFLITGEAGEAVFPPITLIGIVLLWASAIFTIYTGWDYFRAGIHHLIKEDEG